MPAAQVTAERPHDEAIDRQRDHGGDREDDDGDDIGGKPSRRAAQIEQCVPNSLHHESPRRMWSRLEQRDRTETATPPLDMVRAGWHQPAAEVKTLRVRKRFRRWNYRCGVRRPYGKQPIS